MLATVAQCLERARQCEWSASLTNDEGDRNFLLWKAQQWMKPAEEKERQALRAQWPKALGVYERAFLQ